MRIEAYTQVQQVYETKKSSQTKSVKSAGSVDQVQISSFGKDIQIAKAAVMASSDIREEVLAPIKAKISTGTYEVSAESFAEKLMKQFEEAR